MCTLDRQEKKQLSQVLHLASNRRDETSAQQGQATCNEQVFPKAWWPQTEQQG